MPEKTDLHQQFSKLERLAAGGPAGRLLHAPLRYLRFILVNKLLYKVLRRPFPTRARAFFGRDIWVDLPAGTDIFLTGGKTHDSELRLAKFLMQRLRPGATFYDIGAHVGYFSLLAKTLVGDQGRVYAFEPSSASWRLLQKNTAGLEALVVSNRAVAATAGRLKFYEFPALYSEYSSLDVAQFRDAAWFAAAGVKENEVDVISLDGIIAEGAPAPDFIKIDVEGAEDKVIEGGAELLRSAAPAIIMEYLSDQRHNSGHRRASALLQAGGYRAFCIHADGSLLPVTDVENYLASRQTDSDNIVFQKS